MSRITGPIGFRLAHELEGLLTGFRADGRIQAQESDRLRRWLDVNRPFAHLRPFGELASHIERALADGEITLDECDDLLFVVQRLTTVNPHFDACRSGLQVLMGVLAGIAADRVVNEREVAALSAWMEDWSHICELWPFTECASIVTKIVNDGRLGDGHQQLLALSSHFPIGGITDGGEEVPLLVGALCAIAPEISFTNRVFVFTGESSRGDRWELHDEVTAQGGIAHTNVTKATNVLVVCHDGSAMWAFSCYGRKVEKAYQLRKKGHPLLIIHERDFWDALVP